MRSRRFVVSGRVQGVFYRASTARKARSLRLRGHARNLADGRVEVLACGEEADIDALADWLWRGPPASRVTDVGAEDIELGDSEVPTAFTTG